LCTLCDKKGTKSAINVPLNDNSLSQLDGILYQQIMPEDSLSMIGNKRQVPNNLDFNEVMYEATHNDEA